MKSRVWYNFLSDKFTFIFLKKISSNDIMRKIMKIHFDEKLDTKPGAAIYSGLFLKIYNILVLVISNRFAWVCTTKTQLEFFNDNVTNNHLDVGVGSGYYMDNCKFPDVSTLKLTLLDYNINCLNYAQAKLIRYKPNIIQGDIFLPIKTDCRFDSISINYVLHCLPGNLHDKGVVFANLKRLLNPNGVIFGCTILGNSAPRNKLATWLLTFYNKKGVFCNLADNVELLDVVLRKYFNNVSITVIGMVALFRVS